MASTRVIPQPMTPQRLMTLCVEAYETFDQGARFLLA